VINTSGWKYSATEHWKIATYSNGSTKKVNVGPHIWSMTGSSGKLYCTTCGYSKNVGTNNTTSTKTSTPSQPTPKWHILVDGVDKGSYPTQSAAQAALTRHRNETTSTAEQMKWMRASI
jgi:hypothetical protein